MLWLERKDDLVIELMERNMRKAKPLMDLVVKPDLRERVEAYLRALRATETLTNQYDQLYYWAISEDLRRLLSTLHRELIELMCKFYYALDSKEEGVYFSSQDSREILYRTEMLEGIYEASQETEIPLLVAGDLSDLQKDRPRLSALSQGFPVRLNKVLRLMAGPCFLMPVCFLQRSAVKGEKGEIPWVGCYSEIYREGPSHGGQIRWYAHRGHNAEEWRQILEASKTKGVSEQDAVKTYGQLFAVGKSRDPEFIDGTLDRNLRDKPTTVTLQDRVGISRQIIDLVAYIHSQHSLHRHLCPQHVRMSLTGNSPRVKLTHEAWDRDLDLNFKKFELEKERSFNDPALPSDAFDDYQLTHEIYALTRLIVFVMSGSEFLDKTAAEWRFFELVGTSPDLTVRFKSVEELKRVFEIIVAVTNRETTVAALPVEKTAKAGCE